MSVLAIANGPDTCAGIDGTAHSLPPSMVERMTLIMDAFDSPSTRLTLEQIARATHLPRSTAHRILEQLVRLSWLSHSSFGYALGSRSLTLGGGSGGQMELREAAAAPLHELQVRTGTVAHLAILDGAEICYLDKVGGQFAAAVPSRVGGRAPAHCTALGKAMLAWLPAEEVEELLATLGRQTPQTICDVAMLHRELSRVRAHNGLAFERGECFANISCVAAAVRGPESPVAALSLVGGARTPLERVAPLVVDAARQVGQRLYPGLQPAGMQARSRRRERPRRRAASKDQLSSRTLDRMLAMTENAWF